MDKIVDFFENIKCVVTDHGLSAGITTMRKETGDVVALAIYLNKSNPTRRDYFTLDAELRHILLAINNFVTINNYTSYYGYVQGLKHGRFYIKENGQIRTQDIQSMDEHWPRLRLILINVTIPIL